MNVRTILTRWSLLMTATIAIALIGGVSCVAQSNSEPTLAPQSPAFEEYVNGSFVTTGARPCVESASGLVPETIDFTHLSGLSDTTVRPMSALPSSYDLRTLNKLTPIRDQGACGSCWDFASMGSLESSLMPGENSNFSENNLKNLAGFDISCCDGGNRTMSTSYFARWAGPIAESDDPYNTATCSSPAGLSPRKHVQEVIFLPNRTDSLDNDSIKQAVMTYGAVYSTYYHSDSYYKSSTASYYCGVSTTTNHAICIVGWDDNYSAANFLSAPPGNGAFLIRNSWGTWWGQSGYFWMSYYDAAIGRSENAVFRAEPSTNYDAIYQYDTLGWVSNSGYGGGSSWFANVFTAVSSSSVAAASWYTPAPNCSYELYVYISPTNGPLGSAPAASATGTIATTGYHTVQLPTAVPVASGQKFSVVVKSTAPGYSYSIPLERPYSGYASGATAGPGQSYISSNGSSWTDTVSVWANTNVCLKAFTSSSGSPPTPGPGVMTVTPATGLSASGAVGGPFTPSSQAYTITNTGQSPLSWTASASQTWMSLSSSSGSLAAGATAVVTLSVNTSANNLAAGSYSGAASFTNTTTGNGNASRAVTLTVNAGPGVLTVTPATGLNASGTVGGPFSPTSQVFTLANTGKSTLSWTASASQTWMSLSISSGSLAAGATATVTVSINSAANSLAVGSYSGAALFTNTTSGSGNTSRTVSLTVKAALPGVLSVTPTTTFSPKGPIGGPFSPSSQVYTLANTGTGPLTWNATATSWITLSSNSGTLAPGATFAVTASINSAANNLAVGTWTGSVTFTNVTNGNATSIRNTSLTVSAQAPPPVGGYQVLPTSFNWINPSSHVQVSLSNDSVSTVRSIPFPFTFYGKTYSSFYIGSNGLVSFPGTWAYLPRPYNSDIPSAYPNPEIYPFWDNLNPAYAGSVRTGVIGNAPNRQVVITWLGVPSAYATSALFSFQAILCEGTNDIIFQYLDVAPSVSAYGAGQSATIGIENGPGAAACRFSFNTRSVTNNMAIRFTSLPTRAQSGRIR